MCIRDRISSYFANRVSSTSLRIAFGAFIIFMGVYMIFGALRKTAL